MTSNAAPPVTQRVPPETVDDLLAGTARAAISYLGPDGPECVPAVVRRDAALHVGVDARTLPPPRPGEPVVLVADDGRYWFQLRACVWRGTLAPADDGASVGSDDGLVWFRLEPRRVVAWDYGRLHEEPAG